MGSAGFSLATSVWVLRTSLASWGKMAAPWWRAALSASGRCRGFSTSGEWCGLREFLGSCSPSLGLQPGPGAGVTSQSLPAVPLSRRTPPLGPMPNEDIDVSNLERLEKYRSFERYRRRAEQEARAPHWWRTYREHFVKETGAGDGRRAGRAGDPVTE